VRFSSLLLSLLLLSSPAVSQGPSSDDIIYDQVRIKLTGDRDVGSGAIDVKVEQGVVELRGKVKTEKHRVKAEKIAKKVKGVQRVVNQLRVAVS